MQKLTQQYIHIRDDLLSRLYDLTEICFTEIWDPITKYNLIREVNKLVEKDLHYKYPKFPIPLLPKVKFKVCEEEMEIETSVQTFLNTIPNLIFLGTEDIDDNIFDFYTRQLCDPDFKFEVFVRYDHHKNSFLKGTNVAAAEYFLGKTTPLSVAFSYAVEEGYIK